MFPAAAAAANSAAPEACGTVPEAYDAVSEAYGAVPEAYGAVPEASGAVPEASGAVPEACNAAPEACGAVPEACGAVPEACNTAPETGGALIFIKEKPMNRYSKMKDGAFDVWFGNMVQYVSKMTGGSAPEWTHIPAEETAALNASYTAWHTAYQATLTPHTPGQTAAKNEARKAGEKEISSFYRRFIEHPAVTLEQLMDAGFQPPSPRTPDAEPVTYPEAEVDSSIIRQLTIHFRDKGAASRAKPPKVHGAEIRWAILDREPVDETELTSSDFDTATPFTLTFTESQRGKRVYFVLRWESHTNLKGPWSEIYNAVIP
ncbi:MAG: hypothetical protein LBP88_02090 [Treponema sp.]|jgi:hypothetical protein|nr:hypothetical protein [Treponema sp.]